MIKGLIEFAAIKDVVFNNFIEFKNFKSEFNKLPEVGALYIFVSNSPIGRLVGNSRVLKIGETLNLKKRMARYFSVDDISLLEKKTKRQTAYRFRKYFDKCELDAITLLYLPCQKWTKQNLKGLELKFLKLYLDEHFEVPPLNMSLK